MACFLRNSHRIRSAIIGRSDLQLRCFNVATLLRGRIVPFKLSDIGEGIREVTIKEWFVKPGDRVSQFDNMCEVQSDKASVTITSRYDGLVKTLHHKVDDVALVGQPLVDIELEEEEEPSETTTAPTVASASDSENSSASSDDEDQTSQKNLLGKVLTTPAVRRIAVEKGIRLSEIIGTGKDGRILKEDLLAHLEKKSSVGSIEKRMSEAEGSSEGKIIALKGYGKHMWTTMTRSLSIPHFVYSDECDITKLVKMREEVKEALKKRGVSLTFMPFFVKAISKALEEFPELNAKLDEESRTIQVLPRHNIGVAMDTSEGLIVPNVKDVQNLDVVGIARELNRLQELGRRAAIPPGDLTGGTFTLSNIGVVGGTYTKPVILSPQIVIGAVGRTQKLPRFDEKGNIIAAHIISVSWSADHRVVDGVTMAKFSNSWRYYLENPSLLAINA